MHSEIIGGGGDDIYTKSRFEQSMYSTTSNWIEKKEKSQSNRQNVNCVFSDTTLILKKHEDSVLIL